MQNNIHLTLCEPFYLSPLQTISRERICNHAHCLFFLNINIIISIDKKGIYKVHTCISNMVMEQVSLKKVQFLGKPVYEFNSIRVVLLACNPNCICILSCKLRNFMHRDVHTKPNMELKSLTLSIVLIITKDMFSCLTIYTKVLVTLHCQHLPALHHPKHNSDAQAIAKENDR